MADQPTEVNVATGAAANTSNINVIANSTNGTLKGNPPFLFNGDRHLSKKFLLAFQLWRMINKVNDTMKRPYSWVIVALSYMDGPKVDSWKEEQLIRLDDEVNSGTLKIDKTLWDNFMDSFQRAFTNTNRKVEAYQELCKLRHGESLDNFFMDFKCLVKDANIKLDDLLHSWTCTITFFFSLVTRLHYPTITGLLYHLTPFLGTNVLFLLLFPLLSIPDSYNLS